MGKMMKTKKMLAWMLCFCMVLGSYGAAWGDDPPYEETFNEDDKDFGMKFNTDPNNLDVNVADFDVYDDTKAPKEGDLRYYLVGNVYIVQEYKNGNWVERPDLLPDFNFNKDSNNPNGTEPYPYQTDPPKPIDSVTVDAKDIGSNSNSCNPVDVSSVAVGEGNSANFEMKANNITAVEGHAENGEKAHDTIGVNASATGIDGGTANTSVTAGNITVYPGADVPCDAVGVDADAIGKNASTSVSANKISATSFDKEGSTYIPNNSTGVDSHAEEQGTVNTDAKEINAKAKTEATGVHAVGETGGNTTVTAETVNATSTVGTFTVLTDNSTEEGYTTGVKAEAETKGTVTASADIINATSADGTAIGAVADGKTEGTATVNAGKINSESTNGTAIGIEAKAEEDGSAEVFGGDVNAKNSNNGNTTGIDAYAGNGGTVTVDLAKDQKKTAYGDVTAESYVNDATAVKAVTDGDTVGGSVVIDTGDVTATSGHEIQTQDSGEKVFESQGTATGIYLNAEKPDGDDENSDISVTAHGNVSANGSKAIGVDAHGSDGTESSINIMGEINAEGHTSKSIGVNAVTSGGSILIDTEIDGDEYGNVTATNNSDGTSTGIYAGIDAASQNGGSIIIKAGSVSAINGTKTTPGDGSDPVFTGAGNATGILAEGINPSGEDQHTDIFVFANGDVEAKGRNATAIKAVSENGGFSTVSAAGKVTAEGADPNGDQTEVYSINASSTGSDSFTKVFVGEGTEGQVLAKASNSGETVVSIEGGAVQKGSDPAVEFENETGAAVEIKIQDGITAENGYAVSGVGKSDSTTDITLEGDVASQEGVLLKNEGAEINLKATSDFTSSGDASNAITIASTLTQTNSTGSTNVTNVGDVSGGNAGLYVDLKGEQTSTVIVDGTVSGGVAGIVLGSDTAIGDNLDFTAWEVTGRADGDSLVIDTNGNEDTESAGAINYIVKVVKSIEKLLQYAGQRQKTDAFDNTYETSMATEDVTLTLGENEGLDEIYYNYDDVNETGSNLLKLGAGITAAANAVNVFTLQMLSGGGMLLGGMKTHTHEWELAETITPATCEEAGLGLFKCTHCSLTKQMPLAALGHDYVLTNTTAATCAKAGVKEYTCSRNSSHTKTEEIPIDENAHNWDEGSVTEQPTCAKTGTKLFTCLNDKTHTKTETIAIDKDAHNWDAGKVTREPNCAVKGEKLFTCQNDKNHTKTEEIPIVQDAHNWDEGTVTKKPTCSSTGTRTYTCKNDASHVKTEEIPCDKNAHDLVHHEGKKPTCSAVGWDEYDTCNNCDYSTYHELPATGHNATNLVKVEKKDPTCDEEGAEAYWKCPECGMMFSDPEGKNEIKAPVPIQKIEHNPVTDPAVEPTCVETGLTEGSHCADCKAVLVAQEIIKAKGHTSGAPVKENETPAQIGVAGSYEEVVYCTVCGAELSRETVTIDPLPDPNEGKNSGEGNKENDPNGKKQGDDQKDPDGKKNPDNQNDPNGQKDPNGQQDPNGKKDPSGQQDPNVQGDPNGQQKQDDGDDGDGTADPGATAVAGISIHGETDTYIEYLITLHIPAEGFPEGLQIINELGWTILEDGTIVRDTLMEDPKPEYRGLHGEKDCEATLNEYQENEETGAKVTFTMYQNYTDETNNTPGLAPGAREVQILFRAAKGTPWPEGQEHVDKLILLFPMNGQMMKLEAELSNKSTEPVYLKLNEAVVAEAEVN